jgi:putative phosphoesterase
MLLGIMGDSHDNLANLEKAVHEMNERSVDLVLHTGDFISPFTIPALANCHTGVMGVIGNNDGDREMLNKKCTESGTVEIQGNFVDFVKFGRRIALIHGHEQKILDAIIESELYDMVVHGHTHKKMLSRTGKTLVLNPGEVCGYLTGDATCAIVDLHTMNTQFIYL